jgi:prepilin-type N-terminal cleavage/methylation domain-containing protein
MNLKRKEKKSTQGFTLIELMVAVALVVVLFFGLASVYMLIDDSWARGASLVNLQRDGSYAMTELSMAIRMGASAVISPTTQLTIKDGNGTNIGRFYLEGSDNSLRDDSGTKVIPSSVDSLAFSQAGSTIFVSLVLVDDSENKVTFSTAASLRN